MVGRTGMPIITIYLLCKIDVCTFSYFDIYRFKIRLSRKRARDVKNKPTKGTLKEGENIVQQSTYYTKDDVSLQEKRNKTRERRERKTKRLSFWAIRPIRSEPISDFRDVWQTGGSHHSRTGRRSIAGNFPS